jgi:hypothetical protein
VQVVVKVFVMVVVVVVACVVVEGQGPVTIVTVVVDSSWAGSTAMITPVVHVVTVVVVMQGGAGQASGWIPRTEPVVITLPPTMKEIKRSAQTMNETVFILLTSNVNSAEIIRTGGKFSLIGNNSLAS